MLDLGFEEIQNIFDHFKARAARRGLRARRRRWR